jgi:hypothetical protein
MNKTKTKTKTAPRNTTTISGSSRPSSRGSMDGMIYDVSRKEIFDACTAQ